MYQNRIEQLWNSFMKKVFFLEHFFFYKKSFKFAPDITF